MTDNFFNKKESELEPETEQQGDQSSLKIGDKEYTQDELNQLVGLGEMARELEGKWNTKIDRLYPEFTKKSQRLSEYEQREQELEREKERDALKKAQKGEDLLPEEQAKLVRQELKKHGVVLADEIDEYIARHTAVRDLIKQVDEVVANTKQDGKPLTTKEELLAFMDDNGVKNPELAYKLKFEKELRDWEEKQLSKLKQPGLVTEETSTAGSKEPAPVKVTKENVSELLKQALAD